MEEARLVTRHGEPDSVPTCKNIRQAHEMSKRSTLLPCKLVAAFNNEHEATKVCRQHHMFSKAIYAKSNPPCDAASSTATFPFAFRNLYTHTISKLGYHPQHPIKGATCPISVQINLTVAMSRMNVHYSLNNTFLFLLHSTYSITYSAAQPPQKMII